MLAQDCLASLAGLSGSDQLVGRIVLGRCYVFAKVFLVVSRSLAYAAVSMIISGGCQEYCTVAKVYNEFAVEKKY